MEARFSSDNSSRRSASDTQARRPKRQLYHRRLYHGILIFVVIAGLPLIGLPSLRTQLRTRVRILSSAATGQPLPQAPVKLNIGENQEPFPREYEHAFAEVRPSYLPKIDAPAHSPYRIIIGGEQAKPPEVAEAAPKGKPGLPPVSAPPAGATNAAESPTATAGTDSKYRKGQSEQEAYDLLLSSNATLAGMVKGSDPTLRFQDWAAADMGQGSYYVMVTFVQTLDNTARKYIWNVKLASKEIVPLSAYAREISK